MSNGPHSGPYTGIVLLSMNINSWEDFREKMPIARSWAYLDHAAVSPLPEPTREAIATWTQQAAEQGGVAWPIWNRTLEGVRKTAADLVGARTDEIALVRSTTEGISLVAEGFPWQQGDNVVTLANEFPSNLYPWMNLASRGVETRRVPVADGVVNLQQVESACDERTRIISMSWIGYSLGWRIDPAEVAELAHRRGVLFFLDAIQGLGAFPLDVRKSDIDFFAADGHKWMLGPEGAGLLYVRHEHLNRLRAIGVGWNSVVRSYDFDHVELELKPAASRYEGGTPNSVGFTGLGASLQLLASYGIERIAERVLEITGFACERLKSIGASVASHRNEEKRCSGIVAFEIPGKDPQALRKQCLDAGVALGCRSGRLRISPHAYANESDIERLVDALTTAK